MWRRLLPFLILIVTFTAMAVTSSYFRSSVNLSTIVRQTAVINMMALGMTLIIITGGIDLSVGSILAFAGVVGTIATVAGLPIPLGILVGIGMGLICGLANGLLVTLLSIPPFIVTLGTLLMIRGLVLLVRKGQAVYGVPPQFAFLGSGNLLGVPFVLWLLVACALLTHFTLEHTRLGRYAFAIGSNTEAAVYAGIPVKFHTTAVYAIGGMLTGLAGMIETSRLMSAQPTSGQGYELYAIAAVVIGGGNLRGGEGSVLGTLTGAFLMGLLSNFCDLKGWDPFYQQVIIGAVIIVVVAIDEYRKRKLAT